MVFTSLNVIIINPIIIVILFYFIVINIIILLLFLDIILNNLWFQMGILPMGNQDLFPWGKPAARVVLPDPINPWILLLLY